MNQTFPRPGRSSSLEPDAIPGTGAAMEKV